MNKKREWSLKSALARIAAMVALSSAPGRPVNREPDPANCPVCGTEHRTGKIACCAEHGRAYRAERRHHSLPAKNGVEGRRYASVPVLRLIDSWPPIFRTKTHDEEGNQNVPHRALSLANARAKNAREDRRPSLPETVSEHAADDTSFQLAP